MSTKNKIILIEPIGGMNFNPEVSKRGNSAPPYAIETLGGYLGEKGQYDVSLIHQRPIAQKHIKPELEGFDDGEKLIPITDEDIVGMIAQEGGNECLMVGISAITPLFNRSLQIAKKIKERFPEIKIVIGGYHASALKEKVYLSKKYNGWENKLKKDLNNELAKLVDFFIAGEGEQTILELADAFKENRGDLADINGIIYRDTSGKINKFKDRDRFSNEELDYFPEAYRKILAPVKNKAGEVLDVREIPSSADCTQFGTFPGHKEIQGEIQIQASRGCPGNCSFCSVPMVWGREIKTGRGVTRYQTPVRFRDPESVIAEIKKYHEDPEYKTNYVYFADLTFFDASSQTQLDTARETLELMKEAGCAKIGIGVEGFSPNDIAGLKRPSHKENPDEIYSEGIKKFTNAVWSLKTASDLGMFTRGYFVWGRQNQDEFTEARAKALLELTIPKELFSDYEVLKEAISFIFQQQTEFRQEGERIRPLTADEISEAVVKKFNMEDKPRERFLEIDHLRLSPETPYPGTELSKNAKLRYYDIENGPEGELLRDKEEGKLVKKIGADGEPIIIETEKTLDEMINEGWDDWDVTDQEESIIRSEMDIDEIRKSQGRLVKEFYISEGYTDSARRKLDKFPYLKEAYKYWAQFLKEGKVPIEFEKWMEAGQEIKKEAIEVMEGEAKVKIKEEEPESDTDEFKFR